MGAKRPNCLVYIFIYKYIYIDRIYASCSWISSKRCIYTYIVNYVNIGSVLAAAGLALSAVAPNIPFLFFSAGVLLGNLYSQALCSYIY